MSPRLFTCAMSRGLRVTWTAEELGIELDLKMLPFPPRMRAEDYLLINPLGTVPMLEVGEEAMTESSAICHYLATQDGLTELVVGPDEKDYPVFLDFLHHADATLTFPQTVFMRFAKFEKHRGLEAAGEAYERWFAARLTKARDRLRTNDYLAAGRFTVADIVVTYALYLARSIGLDEHLGPLLEDYLGRMTDRPAFQRAIRKERGAAKAQNIS